MNTLDDAWAWYHESKASLRLFQRLAVKYWKLLPWAALGKDDHFRLLVADQVITMTGHGLAHLDDLAIVVLFSVFEASVRLKVLDEVAAEAVGLRHRAIRAATADAMEHIEYGSFARLLEPFKTEGYQDLIEKVSQVRRYRNWIAHGRRGSAPAEVDPKAAYERLKEFLDVCILPRREPDPAWLAGFAEAGE